MKAINSVLIPENIKEKIDLFADFEFDTEKNIIFDCGLNKERKWMTAEEVFTLNMYLLEVRKTSVIIAHYVNIILNNKHHEYPFELTYILNHDIKNDYISYIKNTNLLRANEKLVLNFKKQDEYFELYNLGSFLQNPHWTRWMMIPGVAAIIMCGILAIDCHEVITHEIQSEDSCRATINAAATAIYNKAAEAARREGRTTEQIEQGRKDASNLMIQGIAACRPRFPNINFNFKSGGNEFGIKTGEGIKPIT